MIYFLREAPSQRDALIPKDVSSRYLFLFTRVRGTGGDVSGVAISTCGRHKFWQLNSSPVVNNMSAEQHFF